MTTSYNGGQQRNLRQTHLSSVQPVEKESMKLSGFNQEEIEKLRILLGKSWETFKYLLTSTFK